MPRRTALLLSIGAISLLASNCASRPVGVLAEYRGHYSFSFEESRFAPCDFLGSDSPWWVIPSNEAHRQRDSLIAGLAATAPKRFFVRWRGTITPRGHAGHLGQSTRYIHVAEILELRPVSLGDCLAGP